MVADYDLSDMRTLFTDTTGRTDLATARVDFALNRGQEFLDNLLDEDGHDRYTEDTLTVAANTLTVTGCNTVREILYKEPSDLKWVPVTYVSWEDMLVEYPETATTDISYDAPAFWTYNKLDDANTPTNLDVANVLLNPPADQSYTIRIFGDYASNTLSATGDKSYWTIHHPHLVVMAAMYQEEVFLRNNEGATQYLENIRFQIGLISSKLTERIVANEKAAGRKLALRG